MFHESAVISDHLFAQFSHRHQLFDNIPLYFSFCDALFVVRTLTVGCGITYCIRNEEVVSKQSVVQQGRDDAL